MLDARCLSFAPFLVSRLALQRREQARVPQEAEIWVEAEDPDGAAAWYIAQQTVKLSAASER